MNKLKHTEW